MPQIFISYKRLDKDKVFPIVDEIRQKTGINCWIDIKGIESGDQFQNVIIDAIDSCDIFVFMLTSNFIAPYRDEKTGEIDLNKQTFTEKEVMYALNEGKRIIPVSVDATSINDCRWLKFNCSGLDCIDWNDNVQRQKFLSNLRSWKEGYVERKDTVNSVQDKSTDAYKYAAFISFHDNDSKFAKWLLERLENFSYKKDEYPLRPLFLKNYEPIIGNKKLAINEKIAQSRFMIVICSPNSARLESISGEVEEFCSSGREKNICPVIIDGEPYSGDDNECYPDALKKHFPADSDNPDGIVGLDARGFKDMTMLDKDVLVTKLASYLLGLTFDEIWKSRRKSSKMILLRLYKKVDDFFESGSILSIVVFSLLLFEEKLIVRTHKPLKDCIALGVLLLFAALCGWLCKEMMKKLRKHKNEPWSLYHILYAVGTVFYGISCIFLFCWVIYLAFIA